MQRFFIILFFIFFNILNFSAQDSIKISNKVLKKSIELNNASGDYIEALSYLKQLYTKDTNNIKTLYSYAKTLKEYKDYVNAEKKYRINYER